MPDVLIVGAGPLGLALALALEHNSVACVLLDARAEAQQDRRVLALSHGSRQILQRLGAWDALGPTPIETIHVSQQGGFGRTLLRSADYGLPALGYVIEAGALAAVLAQCAAQRRIPLHRGSRAGAVEVHRDHVRVTATHADVPLQARLVAYAEGSVAEGEPDIVTRDYGQDALVAAVEAKAGPRGVAYERFTAAGPVALLPQPTGYSAIVARTRAEVQELHAMDGPALAQWIEQQLGGRVRITQVGERAVFPLALRYRATPVAARRIWVGNAAQTLHPVAGQGFNLALRDAWELAHRLRDADDAGERELLRLHASARRLDRAGAIGFTDTLARLFRGRNPLLHPARSAGLLALDLLPPGRDFIAQRMMFGARAWF